VFASVAKRTDHLSAHPNRQALRRELRSPLPASCWHSGLHRRTGGSLIVFLGRSSKFVAPAHDAGIAVLHQVASVEAAVRAQRAGMDVIIAQGIEAGGHVAGEVSTMVLRQEAPRGAAMEKPALPTGAGRAQRGRVPGLHFKRGL
jgi:hypothetical protein